MKILEIVTDASFEELIAWKAQHTTSYHNIKLSDFPEVLHPALDKFLHGKTLTIEEKNEPAMSRHDFELFFMKAWSLYPIRFKIS